MSLRSLLLLGALLLASRADAATWSRTLSWRDSTISLVSACGPLDEAEALAELETGRARAVADLGRDDLPPLGTATDPYVILALADPRCPMNALACSSTAPLSRSTWTLVRTTCGRDVLAAVNHEQQHRYCALLVRATQPCMLSDHLDGPGMRYDVIGRIVPKESKPKPPAPEPTPEPVVKLNKRQADVLARFPARGWVRPAEVGTNAAMVRRLMRLGAVESDGRGRFRRARP